MPSAAHLQPLTTFVVLQAYEQITPTFQGKRASSFLSRKIPQFGSYRACACELQAAIEQQPPPRKGIFRPKMRYAHQGGQNPPLIIIHGNALDAIPDPYRRYLEGRFRDEFELAGTPLRIEFKSSFNPYADN